MHAEQLLWMLSLFVLTDAIASKRDDLVSAACARNPKLAMCKPPELIVPPPLPPRRGQKDAESGFFRQKSDTEDLEAELESDRREAVKSGSPLLENEVELQKKCLRISPLIKANCHSKTGRIPLSTAKKCAAYFRDCKRFFAPSDPLAAIGKSFSSGVNINLAVDVNGIPYYPINEEGSVGAGVSLSAPFGAWGGGFASNVGARDYFSGTQEAGANWVDGKYGYKNGWSVPLVQSLGVEGGQHNTVSVPLDAKHIGHIGVDNGYHVGGYYNHNDHVGVNYKTGDFQHTFGVGVPLANVGFMTGQAVSWPGLDVWQRALG